MPLFKFLGNFIKKLGEIFTSLTSGAEKVWSHLEPEIQQALQDGSGIVEVVNKYINNDAAFILSVIQKEFPQFPLDHIKLILEAVATDLNLAKDNVNGDILITIENIANYLKSRTGARWAKASEFIANTIALILAPEGTAWNKIGTIMWWVYQTFIKKA